MSRRFEALETRSQVRIDEWCAARGRGSGARRRGARPRAAGAPRAGKPSDHPRPRAGRGAGGARGRERAGPTRSHPEPGRDPAQRRRVLRGRPRGRRGRRGRPPPPAGLLILFPTPRCQASLVLEEQPLVSNGHEGLFCLCEWPGEPILFVASDYDRRRCPRPAPLRRHRAGRHLPSLGDRGPDDAGRREDDRVNAAARLVDEGIRRGQPGTTVLIVSGREGRCRPGTAGSRATTASATTAATCAARATAARSKSSSESLANLTSRDAMPSAQVTVDGFPVPAVRPA